MRYYTERLLFLTISLLLIRKLYGGKLALGFPPLLTVSRTEDLQIVGKESSRSDRNEPAKRPRDDYSPDPPAKKAKATPTAKPTPLPVSGEGQDLKCLEKIPELGKRKDIEEVERRGNRESVLERYSKNLAKLMLKANVAVEDLHPPPRSSFPANQSHIPSP